MTNERSLIAEEAVLSSILMKNDLWDEVGDLLKPDDFSDVLHREIYRCASTLIAQSKTADLISVSKEIGNGKGFGNENEVFKRIAKICHNPGTLAATKHYAQIVKEESIDRKLVAAANEMIASVYEKKENRLDLAQDSLASIADEKDLGMVCASEIIGPVIHEIADRCEREDKTVGLPTGFIDIDKMTGGFGKGDLIILAARPSMGKTLLSMNIAEHVALTLKKPVAVFSLEMKKEQLIERSLSSMTRIKGNLIKRGALVDDEMRKITGMITTYSHPTLYIDDKSSCSVYDIRAKCRKLKREKGLSLIVVDYLTLMSGEGENETLRIGNISRGLKMIARDLDVPLLVISQLNRGVENRQEKRPSMADLRQSGAIEQDADLIMFIYRDEVYNKDTLNKGIAEIIIAKQRNGEIGTVNLTFNGDILRFDNCTRVVMPQEAKKPFNQYDA